MSKTRLSRNFTTFSLASCVSFVSSVAPTLAYEARLRTQFERLDTQTRLEEVCDTEVALRINRENPTLRADKVVAYTFKQPDERNDRVVADGAAFRSRGKWFHLQYTCQTGPHHLDVHSLSYEIGAEIGRALWNRYYLYD